ncbi:MAG: DUF350 domain-containing protein [Bryobacterales bacterium]|nr:DUF350 domain-containing protein [Bryobacterales bacterium]
MALESLLNAVMYAVLGVILLVASFVIWDKMTPYDLWKQIIEEKNVALAIVAGAMALGIAIIVAAAVH